MSPQHHCARSTRLPLFGQILAALYQSDMVEEDDIRAWHAKPAAKGEDIKGGTLLENIQRCWSVGEKMIQQFDEQESESEEEENESTDEDEDDDHEENKDGRKKDGDDGSEEESEEESEDEDKAIGKAPPRHPQLQEETEDDDGEEEEEEEEEEGSEKGSSNEGEIAIPTQIKPNPAIHKAAASQETIKATASMSSREIVTPTGNRNSVATVSTAPQVEATQTLPDAKSTPTKGTGVPVVNEEPRHVEESEDDGHDASGEESSEEESDEEHDETSDAKPLRKETNRPDLQSSISGSSPTPPVVSISPPLGTEGPQTIQEPQTPKAKDPKSKSTLAPVAEDVHKAEAGSSGYLSASEASSSKPASTVSSTKVGVGKAGVEEKPEAKDPTTVSVDDHQEHVGEESEESGIDTEEYTDETEEDSE